MLPDEVLLAVFDFCADEDERGNEEIEAWQTLVHVCRRWRNVVFGSPRRLNLRLVCTSRTRALDIWPALPIFIQFGRGLREENVDNIVALLKRSSRVCQVNLSVSSSHLEKVLAAMQQPFLGLRHLALKLEPNGETVPVLPDLFLGESAPCLQSLFFRGIPFPALPKLLLSATQLVHLFLLNIPHSGYFSPEAMITALSTLNRLDFLQLEFQSPRSCPGWASRCPPPPTRFVLPVLDVFEFKGASEYFDDLVALIDAPNLNDLAITFFNDIAFDTPQLTQFIGRTPMLNELKIACVTFEDGASRVELLSLIPGDGRLEVKIPCRELDWQISSLVQVCTSCLPPLSMLEDLYIHEEPYWQAYWQDNIENILWLELLLPFTAVKKLYLSQEIARRIAPTLQELIGDRTTEILPTLQNMFLAGPVPEGINRFVARRRRVTGHPIALMRWNTRGNAPQELSLGDLLAAICMGRRRETPSIYLGHYAHF